MIILNPTINQMAQMRANGIKIVKGKVTPCKTGYYPAVTTGGYQKTPIMIGNTVTQIIAGKPAYHGVVAWEEHE